MLPEKDSKATNAYHRIRRLMERGELDRVDRLTETGLADMLGMNRGPVRESLLRMQAEGLIRFSGHRRGRVIEFTEDVDRDTLLRRYEVRERIEGMAAGLCAKSLTGWQIDELRTMAQNAMRLSRVEDKEPQYQLMQRVIDFMLDHCGNPLVREVWDAHRLRPPMTRSRDVLEAIIASMPDPTQETPNILQVVEAIASHNPDEAERLARARVRTITEAIRQTHWE